MWIIKKKAAYKAAFSFLNYAPQVQSGQHLLSGVQAQLPLAQHSQPHLHSHLFNFIRFPLAFN
jgi:hypothetical protein